MNDSWKLSNKASSTSDISRDHFTSHASISFRFQQRSFLFSPTSCQNFHFHFHSNPHRKQPASRRLQTKRHGRAGVVANVVLDLEREKRSTVPVRPNWMVGLLFGACQLKNWLSHHEGQNGSTKKDTNLSSILRIGSR